MRLHGVFLGVLGLASTSLGCNSSDSKSSSGSDGTASAVATEGAGGADTSSESGGSETTNSGGSGDSSSDSENTDSGGSGGSAGAGGSGDDLVETDANSTSTTSSASGGSSGSTSVPDLMVESCSDLGTKACARLGECAPFLISAYYGDESTCSQVFEQICSESAAGQPSFERCAAQLASCNFVRLSQGVPAGCYRPAGTRALGDSCSSDEECAEGLCGRLKEDEAGTCREPAQDSESCALPERCALPLKCNPVDYTCFVPKVAGDACVSAVDCDTGLTCGEEGVCRPTVEGDTCSTLIPCMAGQSCLDECLDIPWSEDGKCGAGQQCQGLDRCLVRQTGDLQQTAECAPAGGFGEDCGDTTTCVEPLVCRSGKCDI